MLSAQPYFCHVINASLTKSPKYLDRYVVIKRLCIIGGGMLFARYLLAGLPGYSTMDVSNFKSTEWLRGDKVCTFRGLYHLAWVSSRFSGLLAAVGAGSIPFPRVRTQQCGVRAVVELRWARELSVSCGFRCGFRCHAASVPCATLRRCVP